MKIRSIVLVIAFLLLALPCLAAQQIQNRNHTFDGDYTVTVENRTQKTKISNLKAAMEGTYLTVFYKSGSKVYKFNDMMDKHYEFEITVRDQETNDLLLFHLKN